MRAHGQGLAVAAVLLASATANADLRSFTYTYEYSTVPEGRTALQLWHTQGRASWDASSPQAFEQVLELEHGVTEHWDVAMHTVFAQVAGDAAAREALHLDATRLETRYRLADRAEWPVDTVLFFAATKDFGRSVYALEARVIVARDFDRWTLAANAIAAVDVGNDVADTELELGWAAGATYQATPRWRFGAETWGARLDGEVRAAAGPAVSWAAAANFWVAGTAGFGVTDEADAFSARVIAGIEL